MWTGRGVFTKFLMIEKTLLLALGEQLPAGGAGVVLLLVQPQAVVPEDVLVELDLMEETSATPDVDTFEFVRLLFMRLMSFGRN